MARHRRAAWWPCQCDAVQHSYCSLQSCKDHQVSPINPVWYSFPVGFQTHSQHCSKGAEKEVALQKNVHIRPCFYIYGCWCCCTNGVSFDTFLRRRQCVVCFFGLGFFGFCPLSCPSPFPPVCCIRYLSTQCFILFYCKVTSAVFSSIIIYSMLDFSIAY